MTTFVNTVTPFLRILQPDGSYTQFTGGRLDLAEDSSEYPAVLAEATRNPSISIIVSAATCLYCGADFTGDKAKAKLEAHMKSIHFDLWQKELELDQAKVVQREVKARAGYACDLCAPVQTFGSEDDLDAHNLLLHASPPDLTESGETKGGSDEGGGRPGEVAPPAAARPSSSHRRQPASKTATRRAAAAK